MKCNCMKCTLSSWLYLKQQAAQAACGSSHHSDLELDDSELSDEGRGYISMYCRSVTLCAYNYSSGSNCAG